jgi:hypothetical protein
MLHLVNMTVSISVHLAFHHTAADDTPGSLPAWPRMKKCLRRASHFALLLSSSNRRLDGCHRHCGLGALTGEPVGFGVAVVVILGGSAEGVRGGRCGEFFSAAAAVPLYEIP